MHKKTILTILVLIFICFLIKIPVQAYDFKTMLILGSDKALIRQARIDGAYELIKTGAYENIIISGGKGAHGNTSPNSEAFDMKQLLLQKDPNLESKIYLEETSNSTITNYENSRLLTKDGQKIIQPGKKLLIVSDHPHAKSVSYAFKYCDKADAYYFIIGESSQPITLPSNYVDTHNYDALVAKCRDASATVTSTIVDTGIPLVDKVTLKIQTPAPQIQIPGLEFSEIVKTEEGDDTYIYIPQLGEYIAAIYRYSIVTASIAAIYENEIENIIKRKPLLNIGIPGLESFSEGKTTMDDAGNTYIHIPFLSEYLAALYKYGIVIASIIAVVMIINNGLKWIISGGSPEKIKEAQTRIIQSIVGMLLAVGSYALLYNINPELVQFKNLRILTVQGIALNNIEADMAEHGSHSSTSYEDSAAPTAGTFRSALYGSDICGDKNGLNLPTYKQRVDRLIPIVDAWKQLSFDQGGSLYIRGKSATCDPKYYLTEEDYQLNAIANIYATYPVFFNTEDRKNPCFSVVSELATIKNSKRSDATAIREKNKISSKTCLPYINNIYQKTILPRANKAGLTCADCIGWLRLLHTECFDKKNKKTIDHRITAGKACSDIGTKELTKYVFRFQNWNTDVDKKVDSIMSELKFGDIIHWANASKYGEYEGGHYFMYTGGIGLDYEILEMGSGGRGDLVNNSAGSKKAVTNMGMPDLDWAGVRAIKDARQYLKDSFRTSHGNRVACAWRPLDDSHFSD